MRAISLWTNVNKKIANFKVEVVLNWVGGYFRFGIRKFGNRSIDYARVS